MNLTTLGVGIASGIALGSMYALIGLSFTLVIASTGLFAFTFESVVALGGVATYILANEDNVPLPATVPIVLVLGAACGLVLERVSYRPVIGRLAARSTIEVGRAVLLITIGLATAVDAIVGVFFGTDPRAVNPYISPSPFNIDGVPVQPAFVVMAIVLLVVAVCMELVFRYTDLGKRLRASQEDREGAELVGINVSRVVMGVFVLSGALACLAGFLITPISFAASGTGSNLVVLVFAGLALGGFGSPRGAIAGGVIVGLVAGIVPLYTSPEAVSPILMGLIVLVLVIHPSGLFGQAATRRY